MVEPDVWVVGVVVGVHVSVVWGRSGDLNRQERRLNKLIEELCQYDDYQSCDLANGARPYYFIEFAGDLPPGEYVRMVTNAAAVARKTS